MGMTRGKRACLFVAAPALGISVIVFAGPMWERIQEELQLRTVAKSTGDERARALAWLVEHGSVRGIAIVLDELLDWESRKELRRGGGLRGSRSLPLPRPVLAPPGTFLGYHAERASEKVFLRDIWSFQGEFTGLDEQAFFFLRNPVKKPASYPEPETPLTAYEDELERVLREGTVPLRAQALGLLFAVRAQASVDAQWRAIEDLRRTFPALEKPLSRMAKDFDEESLLEALAVERPEIWVIRAAGVIRLRKALPRLGGLTGSPDRERGMAALRSIDDFEGPEADEELARCVLHWSNDVYRGGGEALFRRNKELLLHLLLDNPAPRCCRWWQGLMLGRLGSAEAVPIIASEMVVMTDLAEEMFLHLERLAGPEHREILLGLPGKVRPDQRPRAEEIVRGYLARHPER